MKAEEKVNRMASYRCGKCDNCKDLERVKTKVLACCNPPFSHADDDVIEVWNAELGRLPCSHVPFKTRKSRMDGASEELLRDQARKDWDSERVGKCPNPKHTESSTASEKECPYCSKLIELCQKGVP